MGRKRMGEGGGGGPKRRMQIDFTQIAREREEEEAAELAAREASKDEKKGNNPLLSLLGGEYEDDEHDTSKSGSTASASGNGALQDDPAIDKQLDNFLLELGQITGENMGDKKAGEKTQGEKAHGKGSTQGAWQACLDSESKEYYYWNTQTDEVTWDTPAEYQQQQKLQAQPTELKKEVPETNQIFTETPNETKGPQKEAMEMTETQKQIPNQSFAPQDEPTATGIKREAEEKDHEPAAKKVKTDISTQVDAIPDVKSLLSNSKENDEITALLAQHQSEMLNEDDQESENSDKLLSEIEASVLAISGKFTTFDIGATEPLDEAMDSMDIDPEILLERRELTKMKIEFETRVADWREGALHATYLQHKLQQLTTSLEKTKLRPGKFEFWNLLPVGWTRLTSESGTYFANVHTNETSWCVFDTLYIWPPETQPPPTSPLSSTPPDGSTSSLPSTTSSLPSTTASLPSATPPLPSASSSPVPPTSVPAPTVYSSAPVRYSKPLDEDEIPPPPSSPPPPPDSPPPPPPSDSATPAPKKKVQVSSAAKPAKLNSVFAKWASARTELVGKPQQEEEETEEDLEAVEHRKRADIEQWRTDQIKTGESDTNANFLPVAVDWRERVERARRIASKEKSPTQ